MITSKGSIKNTIKTHQEAVHLGMTQTDYINYMTDSFKEIPALKAEIERLKAEVTRLKGDV